ncbi:MAG: HAD family hydrolase [Thermodesulfobacteriota bacterium]|nr:HAD family hydrolase [Thermodesulfobacteriota bacterium]
MIICSSRPAAAFTSFVFLDRDGILNVDRSDHVKRWSEFQFYPDALEALRKLRRRKIEVILVSNQSALNRGLTQWDDFLDIHRNMLQRIRAEGGDVLAAFYCPHRPDEACDCRKPRPGMLRAAADLYGVPLHAATMMGDKLTDLEAARAAGCRAVWIRRPGTEAAAEPPPEGAGNIAVYGSLAEAVEALFTLRACPKTSS